MLISWMTHYIGKDRRDAGKSVAAIRDVKRVMAAMNRIDPHDIEQMLSETKEHANNVVNIADLRKGRK